MLSEQQIKDIAGFIKVTPEILKAAIEAKEVKPIEGLDLTGLQVFTADEISQRDQTNKESGKNGYITAGKEIAIKELKQLAGVEFEGKDPKTLVDKLQEKTLSTAKLNPTERERELQTQIQTLTQSLESTKAEANTSKQALQRASLERQLISNFPANTTGDLSADEKLLLFNSRYEAAEVDGVRVWKDRNSGQEIRDDKTGKPKADGDVLSGFFQEKKWITTPADPKGGRGGGNEGGAGGGVKPAKYSEAVKQWQGDGKNIGQPEFTTYVSGLKKDNPAFVMDLDQVQ